QVSRRIPGEAATVRIETRPVEVVTVFIRFASSEDAAFDFYIAPLQTASGHAERDMRGILPVMADRCIWIVHCTRSMHECGWAERRFTWITEIDVRAEIVLEFLREAER